MDRKTCQTLLKVARILAILGPIITTLILLMTIIGAIIGIIEVVIAYFLIWKPLKEAEELLEKGQVESAKSKLTLPLIISFFVSFISFILVLIVMITCKEENNETNA